MVLQNYLSFLMDALLCMCALKVDLKIMVRQGWCFRDENIFSLNYVRMCMYIYVCICMRIKSI